MISIAIVENEDSWAELLEDYLHRYEKQNPVRFCIRRYRDGYDIAEKYPGDFDIILMDIEMDLMNGMEAAETIREKDESVEIIFVTNMAQYALQGYRVRAIDYILKPIEYVPFAESIRRALQSHSSREEKYIVISTKSGTEKLSSSRILWIESRGHRLTFHMKNDRTAETTVYTMKKIEEELNGHGFSRCSSGCLVNLKEVDGFGEGSVQIRGTKLPVSRGRKAGFLADLTGYINR